MSFLVLSYLHIVFTNRPGKPPLLLPDYHKACNACHHLEINWWQAILLSAIIMIIIMVMAFLFVRFCEWFDNRGDGVNEEEE